MAGSSSTGVGCDTVIQCVSDVTADTVTQCVSDMTADTITQCVSDTADISDVFTCCITDIDGVLVETGMCNNDTKVLSGNDRVNVDNNADMPDTVTQSIIDTCDTATQCNNDTSAVLVTDDCSNQVNQVGLAADAGRHCERDV